MCAPLFFMQVKYETWILALGYINQMWVMICLPLLSHNNLVSFYYYDNTIWKESCDRYCSTVKISQQNLANVIEILWCKKLQGSGRVEWQWKKEDYVIAGEHEQFLFVSCKGSKTNKWTW